MFGGPRVVWDYSTYCCYILRVSVCIYVNRNDCVAVEDVLLVLNVRTLLVYGNTGKLDTMVTR